MVPIVLSDRTSLENGTRTANVLSTPVVVKVRFNAVRHDACAALPARGLADGQGFGNRSMTNTNKGERRTADRITSAEVDGVLQSGILI